MIAGAVKLPTIIFDEIDTGVSGFIAEKMALIIQDMGRQNRQVISITHLPQIAAATGNRAGTDAFVNNAPGWFFTYTKQVSSVSIRLVYPEGSGFEPVEGVSVTLKNTSGSTTFSQSTNAEGVAWQPEFSRLYSTDIRELVLRRAMSYQK